MSWNDISTYASPAAAVGIAIAIILLFIFLWEVKPSKRNWPIVPGAKPIVGNQFGELGNFTDRLEEWCDQYGQEKGMYECNIFGKKFLIICGDEKATFIESKRPFGMIRDLDVRESVNSVGGHGLFSAEGKNWTHDRKMVSPMFNKKNVKDYLPAIKIVSKRLVERWVQDINSVGVVSILPGIRALANDIISLVAFAMDLDSVQKGESPEGKDVSKLFKVMLMRFLSPFPYWKIPIIGEHLDGGAAPANRLKKLFTKLIKDYEKMQDSETMNSKLDSEKQQTFLGKVIQESKKEKTNLDRVRLVGNLFTLFAAGVETSQTTMVSSLYELAKDDTGLQEELVREVATLGDLEEVSMEDLNEKLPRMRSFVYEVLRIRSPIAFLVLENTSPIELEGVVVPSKTRFAIMTQYIQQQKSAVEGRTTPRGPRDADLRSFCARRYLVDPQDESKPSEAAGCKVVEPAFKTGFRTFGMGPRVCPGRVMAETEILFTLSRILRKVQISLEEGHAPMNLINGFTQYPDVDVRLVMEAR